MLTSSAFVFFMTPGLALFYGGLIRTKHSLNMVMQNVVALGVMTIQWFFWGYSLAFSEGNVIIGDLTKMFFSDTHLSVGHPLAPTIPEAVFCMYQLMFSIITPALITGATADRFKFKTYIVFLFVWATCVYDPICHQIWHPNGWLFKQGMMDFAGGVVVHAVAATAALVCTLMIGNREGYGKENFVPHSPMLVVVGTGILWFGWFGFNAGSAVTASPLSAIAFMSSQVAAAFAGITWMVLEWNDRGFPTATGLSTGYVAGLATITPPSGFVGPLPAMAIGVVSAVVGYYGIKLRQHWKYDDALDVFAVHGLAASSGVLMTGIFADRNLNEAAVGFQGKGGWLNHNYEQLAIQLLGLVVGVLWSAVVTYIICVVLDKTMGLRVSKEDELKGLDKVIHDEQMYQLGDEPVKPSAGAVEMSNGHFVSGTVNVSPAEPKKQTATFHV